MAVIICMLKTEQNLPDLFYGSSRDTSPRDYAKSVLGEDSWEPYWETTDDVYSDVIDVLNENNLGHLSKYIIEHIGGQEFSLEDYDDELFHTFSTEQGTEGTFQITKENVMRLIKDENAMKEMFKGDLSDLKSELYSIHNNALQQCFTKRKSIMMCGQSYLNILLQGLGKQKQKKGTMGRKFITNILKSMISHKLFTISYTKIRVILITIILWSIMVVILVLLPL